MAECTEKQLQTGMAGLSIGNQIQALIEADKFNAFLLTWVSKAKSPLSIKSLETAVAFLSRQNGHRLDHLETNKFQLTEEYIQNLSMQDNTPVFKIVNNQVHFERSVVKNFFVQKSPLDELELWNGEDLEFLLAKACVAYIVSLEEFRDLPLPVRSRGRRFDLDASNPFLTYASSHWHQHIHSSEDARRLEPFLDQIIDPGYNTVYLWIDQSSHFSGNGPRTFIRSRQQVSIMRDIPWLALYLLESTESEPDDLFPARDLATITTEAPRVLQFLIRRKPEYYIPGITKSVLVQAANQYHDALETLQEILPRYEKPQFPARFLQGVAYNKKGDKILEYLFTKWDVPITYGLLATAAGNNSAGYAILRLCFDRHPDIQVNEDMMDAAIASSNSDNLRLLLQHDPEVPVGDSQLERLVTQNREVEKLEIVYDVKGETLAIPTSTVESAIKLNLTKIVDWIFETYGGIEITERILCAAAAGNQTHSTALAEFFFNKCDRSLISSEVLHAAVTRWNSADKMTALVLRYGSRDLVVSDELLLASSRDWDGKILDILLEHQPRQEVPTEIVDDAIRSFKAKLSWKHMMKSDVLKNTLLNTLKKRVPNDPYLQKMLAETDFTVPTENEDFEDIRKRTAVPDAASDNNLDGLKGLLDEGMDVNARYGRTCTCDQNHGLGTALQRATRQRNLEMVKVLLERGADPNIQEGDYGNPLQEAAMAGDLDVVKVLIAHNAEINLLGGHYASPLIAAARANEAKIFRYLLGNGGDINMTDDDNAWSPCLYAIAYEGHDVLRFLSFYDKALPALGELIASPPSKFVKTQLSNKGHGHFKRKTETPVEISDDGLNISINKESSRSVVVAGDHPIIPTQNFYFEIKIDHAVDSSNICIGFCSDRSLSDCSLPGRENESWGYNGQDGYTFEEGDYQLAPSNPSFGSGDVVGCGINFASRTAYFTKNGVNLGTSFYMISGRLFPIIGFQKNSEARVIANFGEAPFSYDFKA